MMGRSWRGAALFGCLTAIVAVALPWAAAQPPYNVVADESAPDICPDASELVGGERRSTIAPNVEWQLSELVRATEAEGLEVASQAAGAYAEDDKLRVVADCVEAGASRVADFIEGGGGVIEATWGGLIQCLVDPGFVGELADVEGVLSVRLPPYSFPCVESQGVPLINADDWHAGDIDGSGIRVGILDGGFSGYDDLLGSELPSIVATRWPLLGEEGTSIHGTACAELVHDIAPGASLYLARFSGSVDWLAAAQWLIDQEVDVISCSIGWLGSGPRDGTSPICAPIEAARNAGIVWAQSAGNSAQRHWRGTWRDSNGNAFHDFGTPAAPDESNVVGLWAGTDIYVDLNWDDTWGAAQNDYDLWVFYRDDAGDWYEVEVSEGDQASGADPDPHEWVSFTAPVDGYYHIFILKWAAVRDCTLELFVTTSTLQYQVPEGSVTDNAASPDAMTVGAVNWQAPNEIEFFSSQGPTVDGRAKPDIVGPDRVDTAVYSPDSFAGTSAATPHVAGAAALVKRAYPDYDADTIQAYLEANAFDLSTGGKDNVFGSGRLLLPSEAPPIRDFGDAPDATYPTLLASDGARHVTVPGFYLGAGVDTEHEGQPNADATGDDIADGNDDEDGVAFTTAFAAGEQATMTVTASADGYLDAWMDFNEDGDWADTGEQIFSSQALLEGVNQLSFSVPGDMSATKYVYSRFRFSSTGGLSYTGEAADGEVEDYRQPVNPETLELTLAAGWNLVSVPLEMDDTPPSILFSGCIDVYVWDPDSNSYDVPTVILPQRSYWVAMPAPATVYLTGLSKEEWSDHLIAGWHMVGSLYGSSVDVSALNVNPPGAILDEHIYRWNTGSGAFETTSTIEEGVGCWVSASLECDLTMS